MRRGGVRTRQNGFTLMELIAFTAILAIVTAAAAPLIRDLQSTTEASIAGEQLRSVAQASGAYIKAHYSVIQAVTGPTTAAAVSIAALQAEGFLPGTASYIDPWRQTYALYVLQPTAGNLLGVILTLGGRAAPIHSTLAEDVRFADVVVPSAARRAGAAGGFVSIGNIAGSVAGRLYGSAGGWQLDISTTNIPNPGPGHLAAVVYLASGQLVDDVLYRFAVPGNADANRMHVSLDMGGNSITNASNIIATNVFTTGTVTAGWITANSVSAASLNVSTANGLTVGGHSVVAGLVGWSGLVQQLQPQIPLPGSFSVACTTPSSSWSYVAIPINWMPSGAPQPVGGMRTRLEPIGGMYAARLQVAISSAWQDADPNSQAWILILCGNGT
jgi:type II secretory pathway pseudopilin PulG